MKKENCNSFKPYSEESIQGKSFIKQCHCCHFVHESAVEIERCQNCSKSFLPLRYFEKIHDVHQTYQQLFSTVDQLEEKDLIKGLSVLW